MSALTQFSWFFCDWQVVKKFPILWKRLRKQARLRIKSGGAQRTTSKATVVMMVRRGIPLLHSQMASCCKCWLEKEPGANDSSLACASVQALAHALPHFVDGNCRLVAFFNRRRMAMIT